MTRWFVIIAAIGAIAVEGFLPLGAAQPASPAAIELWRDAGVTPFTGRIEAPSFSLPDLTGRSVRLKDFRGRVVLLYFWATW